MHHIIIRLNPKLPYEKNIRINGVAVFAMYCFQGGISFHP